MISREEYVEEKIAEILLDIDQQLTKYGRANIKVQGQSDIDLEAVDVVFKDHRKDFEEKGWSVFVRKDKFDNKVFEYIIM